MRVLVCGGRDYRDVAQLFTVLDDMHSETPLACIIEGGALGADELAAVWADRARVERERYRADWRAFGKSAGARRNAHMLAASKPDVVVAFPGGRGTADMVRRAEAAGVRVIRVGPSGAAASDREPSDA